VRHCQVLKGLWLGPQLEPWPLPLMPQPKVASTTRWLTLHRGSASPRLRHSASCRSCRHYESAHNRVVHVQALDDALSGAGVDGGPGSGVLGRGAHIATARAGGGVSSLGDRLPEAGHACCDAARGWQTGRAGRRYAADALRHLYATPPATAPLCSCSHCRRARLPPLRLSFQTRSSSRSCPAGTTTGGTTSLLWQ